VVSTLWFFISVWGGTKAHFRLGVGAKKGPQHHIIGFKEIKLETHHFFGTFLLIPKSFVKVGHNLKCIFLIGMLID
jgi:hypothetical protein